LVELLLTLALILLLAAAAAFNFSSLQRGKHLDEGMLQFEALLRFARSQAESTGRTIQLAFEDPSTSTNGTPNSTNKVLKLRWEPDPLGAPGTYADLPQTPHYLEAIQDHLNIEQVQLLDGVHAAQFSNSGTTNANNTSVSPRSDALNASTNAAGSFNGSFNGDDSHEGFSETPVISFYPDGSSDSARFVFSSQDTEDLRRMAIELAGVTGSIQRHRAPREGEPLEPAAEEEEHGAEETERKPSP
jgi:type II secretory pathway pseudopilin PulG